MTIVRPVLLTILALAVPGAVAAQGLDVAKIDAALGRSGQQNGGIYKVGFPRTDLTVVVDGVTLRPGLALGSWAAFSGTDDRASVMGDLVLLQDEVAPVMASLRGAGFEITALHNHLLNEAPHVMFMHYFGRGSAVELAQAVKAALSRSKTPLTAPPAAPGGVEPPAWVQTVDDALGRSGNFGGGVLAFGVPRSGEVTLDSAVIPPAEGVAVAINVQEAGAGRVAATGDFVLLADEVNPVISALEANDIQVTALHNHMLAEQPRLFFMHFWAVGAPQTVATGLRAALDQVAIRQ